LYGETGRFPLSITSYLNSLYYQARIEKFDQDSLLYKCYLNNKIQNNANSLGSRLKTIMSDLQGNIDIVLSKTSLKAVKCKLELLFKDFWFNSIHDDSKSDYGNKLHNYRRFKKSICERRLS
jgi:hypothetical protein